MKPDSRQTIKDFLKPRNGQKLPRQGYYKPIHPEKYIGRLDQIIFRSSWEFRFLKWCDLNPQIIKYASEPIPIPFFNPLDKRVHKYYVDFYVKLIGQDGKEAEYLLEVKPNKYIVPPKAPDRMTDKQTANYLWAAKQFITNQAKFEAAKAFAEQRGVKFGIITENFLFKSI